MAPFRAMNDASKPKKKLRITPRRKRFLIAGLPTFYALLVNLFYFLLVNLFYFLDDNDLGKTSYGLSGLINDATDTLYTFALMAVFPFAIVLSVLPEDWGLYDCSYVCLPQPSGILVLSILVSFILYIVLSLIARYRQKKPSLESKG